MRINQSEQFRRSAGVVVAAAMLFAFPATAGLAADPPVASKAEPVGFGKARFGMDPGEVRLLYPKLKVLDENLGAAVVKGKFIARYVLRGQQVEGLPKPTDVELRFWKNQLWVVIVYFGGNDLDTVVGALSERFGPPRGKPESAVWAGGHSTIIVAGKAHWYSMHDNEISKDAQAVFMADFRKSMARRKPAKGGPTRSASPQTGVPTPGAKH